MSTKFGGEQSIGLARFLFLLQICSLAMGLLINLFGRLAKGIQGKGVHEHVISRGACLLGLALKT